jgi:trehalose/maltose hydrolase-like predicted phosphorylase
MDVVLGRERTQRSKVIKQADVVALLGLLPEEFPGDSGRTNFRYYEPRCATAVPSAAPCMGWSRPGWGTRNSPCGISSMRWRSIWQITAQRSLGGYTWRLSAAWLTAVFGFAGLSLQSDGIAFNPKLPASWTALKFGIEWRGRRLRIGIDGTEQLLHATLEAGDPIAVFVKDRRQEVRCDQAMVCPLT